MNYQLSFPIATVRWDGQTISALPESEIQQQLDNVFLHAGDRRKLVLSAFNANRANRRPFDRRKQYTTESVTYRLTITAFERTNNQPRGGTGTLFNLNLRPHNLQRSPHPSYNSIAD